MLRFMLTNSLPVVMEPFHGPLAAISVSINGGFRHDDPSWIGEHHALEHILCRATRKDPSWAQLNGRLAQIGEFEGTTDESAMAFTIECPAAYLPQAISTIGQMLTSSVFAKEDIDDEHQRRVEERAEDSELLSELMRLVFQAHDLGTHLEPSHNRLTFIPAKRLRELYRRTVVARRMAVALTGDFDPDRTRPLLEKAFGKIRQGQVAIDPVVDYQRLRSQIRFRRTNDSQVRFVLGFPTFGLGETDRRVALSVLRHYLTARNHSQIGTRLDSKGLGYSSLDRLWFWKDVGIYSTHVTLFPQKFLPALQVIASEIYRVRHELISESRLAALKREMRVQATVRGAHPAAAAEFYAKQWQNLGDCLSLAQYLNVLARLTRQDIRRVAREILLRKRLCLYATGPLAHVHKHDVRAALRRRSL